MVLSMYICRRCGRVFKSKRAYVMHVILGIEGGEVKRSKSKKR